MSKKPRTQSKGTPAGRTASAANRPKAPMAPVPKQQRKAAAAAASTAPIVATGFRATLERVSRPVLVRLSAMPQWLVPIMIGAVLFAGLSIPQRWAGGLLVLLGVFLAWLIALSWPRISVLARVVRLVITAVIFGFAYMKFTGRM